MKLPNKFMGFMLAAAAFSFTACNNNADTSTTTSDSSSKMTDHTGTNLDSGHANANTTTDAASSNADQDFINYAVTKNTKELAWLQAGINKGTSKELKDHARKMLADHKKLGTEVKDLVTKKSLTMPQPDTANAVDINDKNGKDWDKAWTDKMVDEHQELLDKLKKSQDDVKDADLKALITKTVPVVQSHLDMVKAMQSKMK